MKNFTCFILMMFSVVLIFGEYETIKQSIFFNLLGIFTFIICIFNLQVNKNEKRKLYVGKSSNKLN